MSEADRTAVRVSVIVPYLKADQTIERALTSVLRQTMSDLEIVCVGDGSTDGTSRRIEAMQREDDRIRIVTYPENRGPAYARNRGIESSRGEWIAVLDADDYYGVDRLSTMLDNAGDASVIVDNLMGVDPVDGTMAGILFPEFPVVIPVEQIVATPVPGSSYNFGYLKPLFMRSFIDRFGLRYDERLRTAEDLLFLIRCAIGCGPIKTVNDAGYFYNLQFSPKTRTPSSTSHSLPLDRVVAAALDDLLADSSMKMTLSQRSAICHRRDMLVRDADVSLFRHSVKARRYANAVASFAKSARVRSYCFEMLLRKLHVRWHRGHHE